MDSSNKQKLNTEIRELTDVMNQMDLTDIYRAFHPNKKENTFFSAPHGTFSKIDDILSNRANIHRYKNSWSIPLCLIRSPWSKVRIQQQHYSRKAYKLIETEQSTTELLLGQ